jgi:hypothetical protein
MDADAVAASFFFSLIVVWCCVVTYWNLGGENW